MYREDLQIELSEEYNIVGSNNRAKYLIRDQIDKLYKTLKTIINHQRDITDEGRKELEYIPRKNVKGWDFRNIATK